MATKQEMYNKYNKPGRKVSWERVAQGAVSGAIEGGTLGSKFGPIGTVAGAVIGGTAGGGIGYLTSPKNFDPVLYREMIDRYAKGRRYQARTSANQLSADLGASLTARGLNSSVLGAGIVAGNRGRLMASAEQDIGNFQAGVYEKIAQAEYNAEHAENEQVRQGWLDLAQQIAFTAAEIGGDYQAKRQKETAERNKEQALSGSRTYLEEISGTQRDAQHILDSVSGIPERTTAPADAGGSVIPETAAPNVTAESPRLELNRMDAEDELSLDIRAWRDSQPRWDWENPDTARPKSPSVKEVDELLDEDTRALLAAMLPDYEEVIAEIDELLEQEGVIGSGINVDASPDKILRDEEAWKYDIIGPPGHGPPTREEPHELPETVVTAPRELPPDPSTTVSPEEQRNMLDETQIRGRMNPPATREEPHELPETVVTAPREDVYKTITDTFGISDDVVPPESYMGLPAYYPIILDTEGGYNRADPSKAGVWQISYDDFLNSVENASEYPRDVKDLSNENIRDFYMWYHERTVADVNNEYTPESVKGLFNNNTAFQYMYSDAAVHHGHAGAAHIASQFAVSHAGGDHPMTMINRFDTQRKAYMGILRKNQIAKVNRSHNQGNISLRERDTKVNAINRKWTSLNRRASKTSARAKRILEIGRD